MKVDKAEMVTLKDEILDRFGGSLFRKVLEFESISYDSLSQTICTHSSGAGGPCLVAGSHRYAALLASVRFTQRCHSL